MRILVVGAGAIGGYFGGRLLEKGEDVTFLVRKKRQEQLLRHGLVIDSPHGNISLLPKTIVNDEKADPFDVIIVSTKSYHLGGAIEDIRPYIGRHTIILPLLNGIAHVDRLVSEFGEDHVIGGLCFIETTLDVDGKVIQTSPLHDLVFGELNGIECTQVKTLQHAFSGTKANFRYSEVIKKDMWEKYLFISALSGITSLMRSPIGPIRSTPAGKQAIQAVIEEVIKISKTMNAPIDSDMNIVLMEKINSMGYDMKSSMQRDVEKGNPTEVDHFYKYLLDSSVKDKLETPNLQLIYANLKVYEQSR